MVDRERALHDLLRPIRWDWSSSVRSRQGVVIAQHRMVRAAYPFMTEEEKRAADEWFKKESHGDLWE